MTLRSCINGPLSFTRLASLRTSRVAAVGLLSLLSLGVAEAYTHHTALRLHGHHASRHTWRGHRAELAADRSSAGGASGMLLAPASNLAAAMEPSITIGTVAATATEGANAPRYALRMHHTHTNEDIDVVYRIGNRYIPSAIARLNYFLRDSRTADVSHYDPREFDLLHSVLARLGRPNGMIDIVCGYRTSWSNNFLRTRSARTGVARNSQHMQAKAIDIRIPGVSTRHLRDAALSLHGGGVGYYPSSEFVHVDVGPVRQWSFGGRGE